MSLATVDHVFSNGTHNQPSEKSLPQNMLIPEITTSKRGSWETQIKD